MADAPQRIYRGASAHDRQTQRRETMLDTALTLIGEDGVSSLTVRSVTKKAGIGSRYFYESFASCEDLALAVYDQQLQYLLSRFADVAAAAPHDLGARIRANVEVAVNFLSEDPRRRRLMLEIDSTAGLRERRRQMIRAVADTMVAQAEPLLVSRPVPRERLRWRAHILAAGCADLAIEWLRGYVELSEKQLVHTLSAMLFSALDDADLAVPSDESR